MGLNHLLDELRTAAKKINDQFEVINQTIKDTEAAMIKSDAGPSDVEVCILKRERSRVDRNRGTTIREGERWHLGFYKTNGYGLGLHVRKETYPPSEFGEAIHVSSATRRLRMAAAENLEDLIHGIIQDLNGKVDFAESLKDLPRTWPAGAPAKT